MTARRCGSTSQEAASRRERDTVSGHRLACQRDFETRAQIFRTSSDPIVYEREASGRRGRDLRRERWQPDFAASCLADPRSWTRRAGARRTRPYDFNSGVRLLAITDALGQVTTLSYDLPSDPLKITQVTDPFGRRSSATLGLRTRAGGSRASPTSSE